MFEHVSFAKMAKKQAPTYVLQPTALTHVSALTILAPGNDLAELEVEAFSGVLHLDGLRRLVLAAKRQLHLTINDNSRR